MITLKRQGGVWIATSKQRVVIAPSKEQAIFELVKASKELKKVNKNDR